MTYTINKERSNEFVTWITVNEPNAKGETLTIELHRCTNPKGKMPFLNYGRNTAILIECLTLIS